MARLLSKPSWYEAVSGLLLKPVHSAASEEQRRRIRMIILLVTFHLIMVIGAGLRFMLDGEMHFPVLAQIALNTIILALLYTRFVQIGINLMLGTYAFINSILVFTSNLTSLLYTVTAFVAVSILLPRRLRLPYALILTGMILFVGWLTAGQPAYASVTHENIIMFAILGVLSVTISTSIIDGDLRQIREQAAALSASEQRYRLLAENTHDMVTLHTPDGRFLYASPSYIAQMGYSAEELLALKPDELSKLIHPDDRFQMRQTAHQEALQSNTVTQLEYRRRKKNGEFFWVEAYTTAIRDSSGNIQQLLLSARDITARKQIEQEVVEKHDQLERFFSSALDLLCIAKTDGIFLKVNREWENVLGYSPNELENRSFLVLVHPEDREDTKLALQKLANQEQIHNFTNRYRAKDGTYRFIEWRSTPHNELIFSAARDITERMKMEEALRQSEQRAQALLNAIPDLVFRVSSRGEFLDFKGDQADLYVPPERLIGRTLSDLGISDRLARGFEMTIRRALSEKRLQTYEYQLEIPSRGVQDFEARVIACGPYEVTAIIRNVTEQKAASKRQEQLTERLEAVNAELNDFAHIISHDLKAPLRGIHSLAKWLIDDYTEALGASGEQMLQMLQQRVRHMEAMINGVLEYSRLGQEPANTPTDLNHIVRGIVEDISPNQHCSIVIREPLPTVSADPTRLHQVFQNLIDNAMKHSGKAECQVQISCKNLADQWLFSIEDNGPGIEAANFERIFQIFQTLEAGDERSSTGLGLTIVKRIIEHYGGRVWLESQVGQGSTFYFTLPMKAEK